MDPLNEVHGVPKKNYQHNYDEINSVKNDINNIRVRSNEPDLYGIRIGCYFFWDTLYNVFIMDSDVMFERKNETGSVFYSFNSYGSIQFVAGHANYAIYGLCYTMY